MTILIYLLAGFSIGLSGAMMPGPLLFYTLTKILHGEKYVVAKVIGGHMIAEVVVVALLIMGLSRVVASPDIVAILSLSGGLVLFLMGIHTVITAKKVKFSERKKINFKFGGTLLGGLFFSVFNPGFPVWWASVGTTGIMNAMNISFGVLVAFILGHWLSDWGWFAVVGITAQKGILFIGDRTFQICIRILGMFLALFGLYFVLRSGYFGLQ
jgi:threonine/homoserine/homoserine lactone efflux protein